MDRREILKLLGAAAGVTLTGGMSVVNPVVYTQQESGLSVPSQTVIVAETFTKQTEFYVRSWEMNTSANKLLIDYDYIGSPVYGNGLHEISITVELIPKNILTKGTYNKIKNMENIFI